MSAGVMLGQIKPDFTKELTPPDTLLWLPPLMCSCPAFVSVCTEREGRWLVAHRAWVDWQPLASPRTPASTHSLPPGVSTMAEDIKTKIKNYQTAPFDSRFPNQNQTRNCWQNYLGEQDMGGQGARGAVLTFPWSHTSSRLPLGSSQGTYASQASSVLF